MPLFESAAAVIVTAPTTTETDFVIVDTASMFNTLQDPGNIVPYITGSPWSCTLYTQFIGNTDVVGNSNDVNDPTLKQYIKIVDFELRVTTAISGDVDPTTALGTVTGTANIYPGITPITGDVFKALVEQGLYGFFEITDVKRLSLYKESAWEVNYTLIEWFTPENEAKYDAFVISEYVFDNQKLITGQQPLVTKSEYTQSKKIQSQLKSLSESMFVWFYSDKTSTFLVPVNCAAYDPDVITFWNAVVRREWTLEKKSPKEYSIVTQRADGPYLTLLDVILQQDEALLPLVVKGLQQYTRSFFKLSFMRRTIYAMGLDAVYLPAMVNNRPVVGDIPEHLANPVTDLTTYIVTNEFYLGSNQMSLFEQLIWQLIRRQPVLHSQVNLLIDELPSLPELERFYRIPIIMALLLVSR